MTEPTVALDGRFSDETAAATPWADALRRIAEAEVAWVVTVRPDGRPHATPVVPATHEDKVYFHTGEHEQKYLNLLANPRVLVLAGDTDWEDGLDVAVEGAAHQVTDPAVLHALAARYAHRWDGRWQLRAHDGGLLHTDEGDFRSVLFEVSPVKAFAHSKGDPFGQTSYRF